MYRIAIVEDDREYVKELRTYLNQYAAEEGQEFEISVFYDGAEILENYVPKYDLILLDIEMQKINGMDAAEKIRETDENVVLMFITNMAQYAIRGYSVGALDFVMKPITYYTFSMKIKRALKRVQKREIASILLTLPDGVKKLEARQIYYLEVQNRQLHYHTDEGEIVVRGSLQSAENLLPSDTFAKCNHWYLVNLMHVTEVRKNTAVVGPFELEISRRNRSGFLEALTKYMGGNS
jgi:DNA-binding LytR/AlgR family response regulator